jgi:hypothetical protein
LKNYLILASCFIWFYAMQSCTAYRLERSGYDNLRTKQDTLCCVTVSSSQPGKEYRELGEVRLYPRIFRKLDPQITQIIIKEEACAINAAYAFIESSGGKRANYTAKLYRKAPQQSSVPEFVQRAREEMEIVRRQREEEAIAFTPEEEPLPEDSTQISIPDNYLTQLRTYEKEADTAAAVHGEVLAQQDAHYKQPYGIASSIPTGIDSTRKRDPVIWGFFGTVGYRYGGSTIAGLELEIAAGRLGVIGGAGVFGYTAGICLHAKKTLCLHI